METDKAVHGFARTWQREIGAAGRVSVRLSKYGTLIYQVKCLMGCDGLDASTYRSGHPNDFEAATERWRRHLAWHRSRTST